MKTNVIVKIVFACVFASFLAVESSARPNIVFLLIDDMGWPDVACYGHPWHETPRIDRLAAEGMKFTDFYAASPVCSSTRASIQSGQYSARVGITDFIPGHWRPFERLIVPPIENALPLHIRTPGDVLKSAGYKTAYFGKWHLGDGNRHSPDQRGYDVVDWNMPAEFKERRGNSPPGPKKMNVLTDRTISFIEQNKDEPFFVTLSHHAVHIRVEATEKTIEKYRNKPKPDSGVNHPVYAAMIEDMDTQIGRIVDRIEELGLRDNTIIVFASDNGGLRQIYTGVGEIVSTNAPLRNEKGTVYEGGIRVPLIVKWPGKIPPATACHEPTTTADLMPTFAEWADAELPTGQPLDGRSLSPLLDRSADSFDREAIYFHYPHYHHSRPAGAIRVGKWKLIEWFESCDVELYDLEDDLSETTNVSDQHPILAAKLQAKLAGWRDGAGARMPIANPKHDPAKAHQWWNRRSNKPLDIDAMRRHYDSSKKK